MSQITLQLAIRKFHGMKRQVPSSNEAARRALDNLERMIETIFDSGSAPFLVNLRDLDGAFSSLALACDGKSPDTTLFHLELREFLFHQGHRPLSKILTAQEMALIGTHMHVANPYVPVGLLDERLTPTEVRLARELTGFFPGLPAKFDADFTNGVADCVLDEGRLVYVRVSLEVLGSDNQTVRDPRAVKLRGASIVPVSSIELVADFPFQRPHLSLVEPVRSVA
ncbi:MAG TPA: hypothetical protein VI912_01700 [Candidatus Bilamarchaeaceae archaeon]|nr:hypothetical protein [Candidatus Bilamarchaeaceae archaeon]